MTKATNITKNSQFVPVGSYERHEKEKNFGYYLSNPQPKRQDNTSNSSQWPMKQPNDDLKVSGATESDSDSAE